MGHIAIFGFFISLVTGSWAGFATWHSFGRHRLPLLRHLFHFVVLFNILVLLYLISSYVYINMLARDLSAASPVWLVVVYLAGFWAETGVGFTLIQLTYSSRDREVPSPVARVFVVAVCVFGASFVVGATIALQGNGLDWLRLSFAVLLTVMTQSAMVFLAVLALGRHPNLSTPQRRSARLLGRLLLIGWVAFALVPLLPEPLRAVLGTLDLVWLNLVPVLWLRSGFERSFTSPLSSGHESALVTLASRYGLSMREQEVVKLILRGKSNKEIEGLLFISFNTVKNHIYNIYRKLGVNSRGQLVSLFIAAEEEIQARDNPAPAAPGAIT